MDVPAPKFGNTWPAISVDLAAAPQYSTELQPWSRAPEVESIEALLERRQGTGHDTLHLAPAGMEPRAKPSYSRGRAPWT